MSNQFITLATIVTQIQYRGNYDGYELRHPLATIKELWNLSWQQLREMVSMAEDGTFLQQTTPAALPTTPATGDEYVTIDWPINAVAIFGVRVKTNDRWRPLKALPTAALHDYQYAGLFNSTTTEPVGYILKTIPFGATSTETAGKIMIVPVPTSGTYSLWYLEAWTPLTTDAHTVSGHAAWVEWSVWNTIIMMRSKDGITDDGYRIAVQERERCKDLILARASRLADGIAMEPRDARHDGFSTDPFADEF
jgi:hypothetical protein